MKTSTPWLEHKQWSNATIQSNSTSKRLLKNCALIALWAGISWLALLVSQAQGLSDGSLELLQNIAFIVGGLMLLGTVWFAFCSISAGKVTLTITPYPGAIGGQVGGVFHVDKNYAGQGEFQVFLNCVCDAFTASPTGYAEDRRRTKSLIWQATGGAKAQSCPDGFEIPFCFDVKPNLPESKPSGNVSIHWQVYIKPVNNKFGYARNFEIPVFNIKLQDKSPLNSAEGPCAELVSQTLLDQVMEETIVMDEGKQTTRMVFPPFRNKSSALSISFFAVFTGIFGSAFYIGEFPAFAIFMPSAIAAGLGFYALYLLLNRLDVEFSTSRVNCCRRILGISIKKHQLLSKHINRFELAEQSRWVQSQPFTRHYRIKAVTATDKITVMESIESLNAAQLALKKIKALHKRHR